MVGMSASAMSLAQPPIALSLALSSTCAARESLNPTDASPDDLLAHVAGHDHDAFSGLYDRLSPLVFGLALRTTRSRVIAEEVTQEVFVQVWDQADRFDRARGSARSWVATIAHRRAVDAVRRAQSSADRELSVPPDVPHHDVADAVVEDDERTRVRESLTVLTDLQREVIELAYFGGLTYRQVAERLGAPLGTVKTRMRDGLARIRTTMELASD
jgi:RNA polymerase sigma-70 factor (ECF subfamily)